MLDFKKIRRQALIIPAGWEVVINKFYDIDPIPDLKIKGLPGDNGWMLFDQDLLLLRNRNLSLDVDLGWSPYYNPEGWFVLQLYKGEKWEEQLFRFESKSKAETVEKINSILLEIHLHGVLRSSFC